MGVCVCSAYQVVVEEERPRRARGTAEILRCYPVPIHFQNATLLNSQYYFTAQFPAAGIHSPQPFTVGDNKTYNGYWNAPLLPQKSYSIYYQAVSTANGVGVSGFCYTKASSWLLMSPALVYKHWWNVTRCIYQFQLHVLWYFHNMFL